MASRIPPVGGLSEPVRRALMDLDRRIGLTEGRLGLNNENTASDQGLSSLRFNFTGSSDPETTRIYSTGSESYATGDGVFMDASGRVSFGTAFQYDGSGNLTISGELSAATGTFAGQIQADGFELWDDVPGIEELQGEWVTTQDWADPDELESALVFHHNSMPGSNNASGLYWASDANGLTFLSGSTTGSRSSSIILTDSGTTIGKNLHVGGNLTVAGTFPGSAIPTTLSNMDTIGFNGASSLIHDIDDITMDGTSSVLNMNSGNITNLDEMWMVSSAAKIEMNNGSINSTNVLGVNTITLGSVINGGYIRAAYGSAATPGLSFTSDTNMGLWRYNSTTLGATCGNAIGWLVSNANFQAPGIWTSPTSSAVDCRVITSTGRLGYFSSSLRTKTDVERADFDRLMNVVDNTEVIWYRSKNEVDNPDWGHYGISAEAMGETDPRFAGWMADPDGCDCSFDEDEDDLDRPSQFAYNHACRVPMTVAYTELVTPLLAAVRDLRERVAELEAQL